MDAGKFERFERLLERELSGEEKERLRRIKDTLRIKDSDSFWDIIIAMEYQRNYYDKLPEKIARTTAEILQNISQAAEKEVALAQGLLAESVVKQAEKLSEKSHIHTLLLWGALALFLVLLYGSLLMWAGYTIGSGQTSLLSMPVTLEDSPNGHGFAALRVGQPPVVLLKMPVGIILGALCFCGGIFLGAQAAKDFAEDNAKWRKLLLAAIGCMLPGAGLFSLAVF